jgi:hypothetical protein
MYKNEMLKCNDKMQCWNVMLKWNAKMQCKDDMIKCYEMEWLNAM